MYIWKRKKKHFEIFGPMKREINDIIFFYIRHERERKKRIPLSSHVPITALFMIRKNRMNDVLHPKCMGKSIAKLENWIIHRRYFHFKISQWNTFKLNKHRQKQKKKNKRREQQQLKQPNNDNPRQNVTQQ